MATETIMEKPRTGTDSRRPTSGIKTILLHVQDDDSVEARLETALSLARAHDAHLTCLHVTPVEAFVAFDGLGGVFVMSDVIKAFDESEARLRSRVEADISREDVSWDFIHVTGNVAGQVIRNGALADVIVTGRSPHRFDFAGPALAFLGDLLHRSRTPILIPGSGNDTLHPDGTALIAWDGSFEAANAVRSAVGLLSRVSDVQVIQFREAGKDEEFPGTRMLEYLSRHGIHAEMRVERLPDGQEKASATLILDQASRCQASVIVMGGYSHSRIAEFMFGGVTRSLLADSPLPLLVAR